MALAEILDLPLVVTTRTTTPAAATAMPAAIPGVADFDGARAIPDRQHHSVPGVAVDAKTEILEAWLLRSFHSDRFSPQVRTTSNLPEIT
jgi:hypothetical protein